MQLADDILLHIADLAAEPRVARVCRRWWALLCFRHLRIGPSPVNCGGPPPAIRLTNDRPDLAQRLDACAGRVCVLVDCILGPAAHRTTTVCPRCTNPRRGAHRVRPPRGSVPAHPAARRNAH
jgi:hypothetical protein